MTAIGKVNNLNANVGFTLEFRVAGFSFNRFISMHNNFLPRAQQLGPLVFIVYRLRYRPEFKELAFISIPDNAKVKNLLNRFPHLSPRRKRIFNILEL